MLVFSILYEDDSFTKFYHKEVNMDANASATAWIEKDGSSQRVVTFKPHVSHVPLFLRGWLGSDIAPLMEFQKYTIVGRTITIHSEISAALLRGFTLVTSGDTTLSPLEKGCEVVVKVTIELQTIWRYAQDKVESDAEREAESAFQRWLKIARMFCGGKLGMEVEPLLEREDSFYDAKELDDEEVSSPKTDFIYAPPHSSSLRCSGRLQCLQVLWKRLCFTIWNEVEKEVFWFKHSTFSIKALTTLGFGLTACLTLAILYSRRLKKIK